MQNKIELRRTLLATRRALPPDVRIASDAAIGARVADLITRAGVRTLGVYWPIQGEPDLRPNYGDFAAAGIALALPAVQDRNAPLLFVAWTPGEEMSTDAFGVAVPAREHVPVLPEAILVPCVGFNLGRYRLGYGAGLYDRTLAQSPRPQAIGVAHEAGLAEFESAEHDVALDFIVTETRTLPSAGPA